MIGIIIFHLAGYTVYHFWHFYVCDFWFDVLIFCMYPKIFFLMNISIDIHHISYKNMTA